MKNKSIVSRKEVKSAISLKYRNETIVNMLFKFLIYQIMKMKTLFYYQDDIIY